MKRIEIIKIIIFIIVRIVIIIGGIFAIINNEWIILMQAIITLIILFIPAYLEKKLKFEFANEFEIVIILFIFASMYLGEMNLFFGKLWWWDLFLHAISSMITGAIGFLLIYILNKDENVAIRLNPIFISLFSLCFSITIGVLWEVFEFGIDNLFSANMQKSGLIDTMEDLIVNLFGALVFASIGYFYLKGKTHILDRFIGKYIGEKE